MKESKLFKSLVATFVVIVLGGPAVALAGTPNYFEVKTTVSYTDLNLENEEGVRVLYQRLKRASKEVCGATSVEIPRTVPILLQRGARQCYRETLSNAVEKFDNEVLTRIHAR
ncbi:MAG: UrcA family protein [Gammaproteobacteria bacterium]